MGNDAFRDGVRKWTFVALGSFFLVLGTVGIFLPLLPTTPFLLLTAACYIRGSDRLYRWLIQNRYLGSYIQNYREGRGVSLRVKVVGITLLWLAISYSAVYAVDDMVVRILLLLVALGVTWHLLSLKTFRH